MKKFIYTLLIVCTTLTGCQPGERNSQKSTCLYQEQGGHIFRLIGNELHVDSLMLIADPNQKIGVHWVRVTLYQDSKEVYTDHVLMEPDLDWRYDPKTGHLVQVEPEFKISDFVGHLGGYPAGFYDVEFEVSIYDTVNKEYLEPFKEKYYKRISVDGRGNIN